MLKMFIASVFLPSLVISFGVGAIAGYSAQPQIKGAIDAIVFVKGLTKTLDN